MVVDRSQHLDNNDVMMYNKCMHRTQILLEDRQYESLKAWAARSGRSLSEAVRLAVDRFMDVGETKAQPRRLADIRGIAKDPGGPAGKDHDRILYGKGS